MDLVSDDRISSLRLFLYLLLLCLALFVVPGLLQLWGRPEIKQKSIEKTRSPPDYPTAIPVVGNIISMVWNAPEFLTLVM